MLPLFNNVYAQSTFYPGRDLRDVNGNMVYAIEGGVMKVGNLYYLWGTDRSQNQGTFIGINVYSSPNLKDWTFVNKILSPSSHPDLANNPIVERPKILYNSSTGQYVMWMHYEENWDYALAHVAYATCSTIGGNYTWQGHFRPLNNDSRDMNVYKDPSTNKAYLICSVNSNSNVVLLELNASYTAPVTEIFRGINSNQPNGHGCEGHAIFKNGSTYFWIASFCDGWYPNDNRYYTATSLAGPWTARGNIAPAGALTYQSQVTNVFPVTGTSGTTWVYVGDRWVINSISTAPLIMQPLQVSGTTLSLPWYDQWSVNVSTGAMTPGAAINFNGKYRLVNGASGKAMDVPGNSTTDGTQIVQWPVTYPGTNQQWTIENLGGGEYKIMNVNSGKSLDNPGGSATIGTNMIQYTYGGTNSQNWHIIPTSGGYYRIIAVQTLGKTLEVGDTTDGAGVVSGNFEWLSRQEWALVPIIPPTVNITAPANGATVNPAPLTITANANDTSPGTITSVAFYIDGSTTPIGTDNVSPYSVTWSSPTVGTHTITAKATDNDGAVTTSAVRTITVRPVLSGATYKIINKLSGKALDVESASSADGAFINQWTSGSGTNQQWIITDIGSGYHKIISVSSGKSMDMPSASTADGARLHQWTFYTFNSQKWAITDVGGGYCKIINVNSGKALDVKDGSLTDGAIVHQWPYGNADNQKWQLVRIDASGTPLGAMTIQNTSKESIPEQTNSTISLYPNPSKTQITISGKDLDKYKSYTIVDLFGQVQSTQTLSGQNSVTLSVQHLRAGTYILRLNGKESKSLKFLKSN